MASCSQANGWRVRLVEATKSIAALVAGERHADAIASFVSIARAGKVDGFVYTLALKSAAALCLPSPFAASVHAAAAKAGFLCSPFLASALVHCYGKCADLFTARRLFDGLPDRNGVVWNAMISLYMQSGEIESGLMLFRMMDVEPTASCFNSVMAALSEERNGSAYALEYYHRMQASGVRPSKVTLLVLVRSCTGLGLLSLIKEIHGFAVRNFMDSDKLLGSALVEAYGRCGSLEYAQHVFECREGPDTVDWSAMVSAYAYHGCAVSVLRMLEEMELENIRPDEITFLGVLKACSHDGRADDALKYFDLFTKQYKVEACGNHYSCLVDVLSRAGRLKDAYEVIRNMPVEATAKAWGALLSACRNFKDVGLAEIAARVLFEIEPDNAGNFVLLANVYASVGMHEEAEKVRGEMERRNVKMSPGSSWM